ncbi:MAG TPA: hypothetical protein VHT75_07710 [Acidimicrobiales bacterium]|jgi:hypothetical protein|nr:hypothetical protein [Acidimicrobiales bacterium]
MRRREKRAMQTATENLIDGCDRFIAGCVAETYRGRPVPGWVWINTLTHADRETLAVLADDGWRAGNGQWDGAFCFLAAELLAIAPTVDELASVQRRELLPLELEVLAGQVPGPSTPCELVDLVHPLLARARSRRAHPGNRQ